MTWNLPLLFLRWNGCVWMAMVAFLAVLPAQGAWNVQSSHDPLHTGTIRVEMNLQIRDANPRDLSPVSELLALCFHPSPSTTLTYHNRLSHFTRLRHGFSCLHSDPRQRMLVAELLETQQVVGFCLIDHRPPSPFAYYQNNPRPMISDLVVHPKARRQGIAKTLVQLCETIALGDFSSPVIYLQVLQSNDAAKIMYTDMGYAFLDPEVIKQGDPPEILLMQKQLAIL